MPLRGARGDLSFYGMAELKFGPTTVDLTATVDLTTLSTHHQVTTVSTCGHS